MEVSTIDYMREQVELTKFIETFRIFDNKYLEQIGQPNIHENWFWQFL